MENDKPNEKEQVIESCCAWCHWLYDQKSGEPIRWLNSVEYSKFESHGICNGCKKDAFIEAAL